ncbi:MAG: NADH-quinone oxidoreductase subunit M [Proteobacteria bacterium]|nr:NADH-quinone oxidoreductase subunit M [Pseudomonadota bacterium]
MFNFPILTTLILLPLFGMLLIIVSGLLKVKKRDIYAKNIALSTTILTFLLSLLLVPYFNPSSLDLQFTEHHDWIKGYGIAYSLGIDGLSLALILLTTFLMPICILTSWHPIKKRISQYMMCFLLLESLIIGVFCASDLLLFYLFFEAGLIPMFLIIGVWGGEERFYAAFKFFLYTLWGSVFMLLAILYIYFTVGTTDMHTLNSTLPSFSLEAQQWLWLAFFISFAVKIPMWPVHTWLPDAHVQAPTAGSVILAGVLLKLGGYGFLRISLPMLPHASNSYSEFIFWLSIIAVIYTSLIALMQTDMKKLIAYSSVAHMGFVTAGIFTMVEQGVDGAIFQMVSHGLVSAALFLCVGVLYDRMHTKEIAFYGGLVHMMPAYAFVFMVFMLASVGLPGTSGFIGEFLVLLASFEYGKIYGALLATGMVLGAAYMLWLYARVMFGTTSNKRLLEIKDLTAIERLSFYPIVIMVVFLGIYPKTITNYTITFSKQIVEQLNIAELSGKSMR